MLLEFFNKKYVLSDIQSEVLKVAILDAIKQAEFEKSKFDESDRDFNALQNKLIALNDLADKLGLSYV